MKRTVYLETSVISYLASRRSRDLVIAARQQETLDWWEEARQHYEVFVSEIVWREAEDGDREAARQRLDLLEGIAVLDVVEETYQLADVLMKQAAIPTEHPVDALHVAVAAVNGMDFLLTWNLRHINNATRRAFIERAIRSAGFECPVICTPAELAGEE